jgi:hypothetical protein
MNTSASGRKTKDGTATWQPWLHDAYSALAQQHEYTPSYHRNSKGLAWRTLNREEIEA